MSGLLAREGLAPGQVLVVAEAAEVDKLLEPGLAQGLHQQGHLCLLVSVC
jgi:hypothetical protein